MDKKYININCDVGEGIGNESDLFPLISSCNIACGGHAGTTETIRTCLLLAQLHKVQIGAHPSYPDRENFGRISMDMAEIDLISTIKSQIDFFLSQCEHMGVAMHHIKPHGALYNDIAKDERIAEVFIKALMPYRGDIFLYVPYGSVIQKLALSQDFKIKREAFADRNYNSDLTLVSRKQDNAVITKANEVVEHVLRMFNEHFVKTMDGETIPMDADTYCVHGDTPSAFQILVYITKHFAKHNLYIKP